MAPSPEPDSGALEVKNTLKPNDDENPESLRLDPSEEEALVSKSNSLKASANTLFTSSSYSEAIAGYIRALETLPTYLDYELAVLKSNISACHIKLAEWKEAIQTATDALEYLEKLDPVPKVAKKEDGGDLKGESRQVEEVDDDTADRIEALQRSGRSLDDIRKIRVKALLRRAKARSEMGSWSHLQGAQEDYQQLFRTPNLTPMDSKTVQSALRTLPPKLNEAKDKEMADMMGKLKQLGNGFLKPFGLSTDNFSVVKDEKTGGYSMGFNQNGK